MMRTREGEEEPFLIQQTKSPEIEIFISLRGSWKMALFLAKGGGSRITISYPGSIPLKT